MLRIARGETDIYLGPKAYRALGQILDMQGDQALLSITSLAKRLEVNPSTITRLAHTMGYSGFGALQEVMLKASMSPAGAFYSNKARTALEGGDAALVARTARLCHENQANIDRFVDGLDAAQIEEAVDLIVGAPRISVHGIRQFHAFASFLVYGLRMIRSDISMLDSNALGIAEGIGALSKGDVLISASCAPYSIQVVEAAKAAAEKGVILIAVTDAGTSPLVPHSKVAVFAPHETSFISNSLTTFIVVAECLINACAAASPKRSKNALLERDRIIKRLHIET